MRTKFTQQDESQILSLVGATFEGICGPHLGPDLTSDYVIILTDQRSIAVVGDTEARSPDGYQDEYSFLRVNPSSRRDVQTSFEKGNLFVQYAGEKVQGVEVIEHQIRELRAGQITWIYKTDVGLLLRLSSGAVLIQLMGLHDEVFRIQYFSAEEPIRFLGSDSKFEDELGVGYEAVESLRNLNDTSKAAGGGDIA